VVSLGIVERYFTDYTYTAPRLKAVHKANLFRKDIWSFIRTRVGYTARTRSANADTAIER
jgi:hypothetical protein